MLERFFRKRVGGRRKAPLGREFAVGDVVEQRFDIEQVRRGYMGIVYLAYDRHRRQRVAIKTFQNKFLWDSAAISRFNAEAELWMRLGSHPNIVRALDLRTFVGKPHVVAEYVHGGPLRALVGHLSLQEALDYAIQICWGMRYANERYALLHGDLKPDNVLVGLDGRAKITDFGLARVLPRWQWSDELLSRRGPAPRRAGADVLGGTLPYMAPELLEQSPNIGAWTDVYAFGVTLYELLTGRMPFDAARDESLIRLHLHAPPPDPRELKPQLPPELAAVVLTCLAKRPADRYQQFADLEADLQQARATLAGTPLVAESQGADEVQWRERGLAHLDLGEYREALSCFLEVVRLDPAAAGGWLHLARARLKLWQYDEALRALDEGLARAQSRNEYGQLYQVRGEVFASMLHPRAAVEMFDRGLSYTPNAPGLWREKGALLLRVGMAREAIACLETAVRYDKFDSLAWRLLGDAEMAQGRLRQAAHAYAEAVHLDPRAALAWAHYGRCQLRLGRVKEAGRSFEMALALDPELQEALEGVRQARGERGAR
jgi:tetratricopeptide (TPR) repeat protein